MYRSMGFMLVLFDFVSLRIAWLRRYNETDMIEVTA
jgi:hypothetical protein